MRTHFLSYILGILTVLIVLTIQHHIQSSHVKPIDSMSAILVDVPNQTESDHRKRATLVAACQSLAELIQAGAMTDTDEVIAAFRIETANLRTNEQWHSIQRRIENLLRQAENVSEQKTIVQAVTLNF